MTFHSKDKKNKKNLTIKVKLYTTSEIISNGISLEPKSIIILLYYLNKNYLRA